MMKLHSVMVTGANRGIGLEFVKQLSQLDKPPNFIFATYRNAAGIQDLEVIRDSTDRSRVILIRMEATEQEEVEVARQVVEANAGELTLLINNAGFSKPLSFPHVTQDNAMQHLRVNTVAPLLITQTMLPLLEKAAAKHTGDASSLSVSRAAVLNMTSMVGSIFNTGKTFTQDLVAPSYKASKAALNMTMRVVASLVSTRGVLVVCMCPGWVRTDMGGKEMGEIEPEESVRDMLATLPTLDDTSQGTYIDRKGNRYPF